MRNALGRLATASAVALAAAGFAAPAAAQKIENSYICVFNPGLVAKGNVKAEANRSANAAGGQIKHTYEYTIRGFAVNASARGVANMQANNPRIAYCEQDQVASIIQGRGKPGSGGGSTGQTTPWGITRVGGPVAYTGTGRAFVIDTGIDSDHPDLNVDSTNSRNFAKGNGWDDGNGHGTHVSGTIAAIDNDIGVVGVAAGAPVVAVRVLGNNGSGSYADVIAGIDYVGQVGKSGDVANMSLGGGFSQAVNDAVIAASSKVKFALAAGNESTDANTKSPASANGPNIYTISAFAEGDTWASYSNYGNPPIDYAEPGSSIYSTYKGGAYATLSGTSMATPHAAGILLLGNINWDRTVAGDPDGNADKIGTH